VKVKGFHATLPASATARRDYLVVGAIAAGGGHNLALKTDGTAWSFGSNLAGQIGDGTTTNRKTSYAVPGLGTVVGVAAGASHSLALISDGSVKSWGLNTSGQLGDGSLTSPRKTPVSVTGLAGTVIVALAAGDAHTLALTSAGTVLAWGSNASGQLGIGPTPTQSSTPVPVSGLTGVVAIAAHTNHSLALKANGSVVAWGANGGGQLGDGTTTHRNTPVSVLAPSGLSRVAAGGNFSLAVLTHGSPSGVLWSWGQNNSGQLGDGTVNTPRKNPRGGVVDVVAVEAGEAHALVVLADGSVWGWGPNANGQIGDGSNTWRLFPTRLPAAPETLELDAGDTHSLALASNGQLWAWGGNGSGQLGDGTLATKYSPSQVPGFELASNAWLASDTDQDSLTNAAEYRLGTDPLNPDTNGNGIPDGLEVQLGKSPTDPDSDGDGLVNAAEGAIGTDPFNPDTDGDGALDGADCFPLDPTLQCPQPVPGDTTPATITLTEPTNAVQVP
jgi:alpha-tubulin suppressor-like RCC1 family protein